MNKSSNQEQENKCFVFLPVFLFVSFLFRKMHIGVNLVFCGVCILLNQIYIVVRNRPNSERIKQNVNVKQNVAFHATYKSNNFLLFTIFIR